MPRAALGLALLLASLPARAQSLDASAAVDAAETRFDDVAPPPPPIEPAPAHAPPVVLPTSPSLEVASYALRARLDPARHAVHGEGTLRWRNTSRTPATELWLHLYLNGFEGERTVFMRTTGGEHRGNDRGRWGRLELHALRALDHDVLADATWDPAHPDDRTQLRVTLPRPVAPGEELLLEMGWTSVLPEVFARTGYHGSFHMVAQWFPKVAVREADGRWATFPFHGNTEFYADFGRYDVSLTVPRGWTVGATGSPGTVTHGPDGDTHTFTATRVHDFAWTTWDHFREKRADVGDTAVRVLYAPGLDHAAELTLDVLARAMPSYAQRFGAYPYPGLTVVIPPEDAAGAGGMEYPTLITTGAAWWMPDFVRATEYVTLHEFMHQYFYGMVASDEHAWPFLDEGFTEYATLVGAEDLHPRGGTLVDVPALGLRLEGAALEAFEAGATRHPMPIAQGAADFPTFGSYGAHAYLRTATLLRTVENLSGRARFRRALRAYVDAWRFGHPTPDDFLDVMRRELDPDVVDHVLAPGLRTRGTVNYSVARASSRRDDGRWTGDALVHRDGELRVPVAVDFEDDRGRHQRVTWSGDGAWARIPYEGARPLRAVRVDPDGALAVDARRLDNARLADDAPRGSVAFAVARAAWWLGNLLLSVGP